MAKCTGAQQKSPQLSSKMMEKQSTHLICIPHQGKHNGSALLTNNDDIWSSWNEKILHLHLHITTLTLQQQH